MIHIWNLSSLSACISCLHSFSFSFSSFYLRLPLFYKGDCSEKSRKDWQTRHCSCTNFTNCTNCTNTRLAQFTKTNKIWQGSFEINDQHAISIGNRRHQKKLFRLWTKYVLIYLKQFKKMFNMRMTWLKELRIFLPVCTRLHCENPSFISRTHTEKDGMIFILNTMKWSIGIRLA